MLPTDFGNLRNEHPTLAQTFDLIENWITGHPDATFLDVRQLFTDQPTADPLQVTTALSLLVALGRLKVSYRVVATTNNQLTDDSFASAEDIPDEMWDTLEGRFKTQNADVIPVFRATSHADAR